MKNIYFGKNLKYLRKINGLNQTELPDSIGFKASTWSGYELEKSFPKFEDLLKISEYFDISEGDLINLDLSNGGDYKKKKVHKIYKNGGDYGGDVGGDWVVNEPIEPYITTKKAPTTEGFVSEAYMNERLADKSATIAALNDTIKALKDTNATLNALIQEMGKDSKITSKHSATG